MSLLPCHRLMLAGSFCLLFTDSALANNDSVFDLGQISIVGTEDGNNLNTSAGVSSTEMRRHDRETLGEALNLLPGVSLSKVGARNEQMVYVRGFDLRQVPVFVDGIPVYVPYDGYADLGRFTTFDLARVEVSKGFSSMTYGPNTLGGAINLITRRPQKEFEGEVGASMSFTDRLENNANWRYANFGSNQGSWYMQAGFSYLDEDYYRLPGDFSHEALENGGRRENSDRQDKKYSFKLGLTPNETDEYAIGFVKQNGEKGNPPYAGHRSSSQRYWRWPKWDKTSTYINTATTLADHRVKVRLYHDIYENDLYAYDNSNYNSQTRGSSFRSYYSDYMSGLSLEDEWTLSAATQLRFAYHFKRDVHHEHDAGEPWQRFEDQTQSFAIEGNHALTDRLTLVLGVSHDRRDSKEAETYTAAQGIIDEDTGRKYANNGQLGLFFKSDEATQWRFTIARKSRFPTIKDRYSYRFGSALPNPSLKIEHATHFEVGVQRALTDQLNLNAALFRSHVKDLLQSVRLASSMCSNPPCSQMQNVSEARMNGVELAVDGKLGSWDLNTNYLYLNRQNRSGDGIRLTDTPKHKAFFSLGRQFGPWSWVGSADVSSDRYTATDGSQKASGFAVFNLKGGYNFGNGLQLDASLQNLTDKEYAYSEGYPEAGRTLVLQANLSF